MADRVLLYVEDEDAAAFLFETALREAGISVRMYRAKDGEQALSFLRLQEPFAETPIPDLVVLDLNLPRKNGLEVMAEVKNKKELSEVPVVVFTSSSLASDRRKSFALGAREYITKPATFDGFVEAVKAACSYMRTDNQSPRV